MRYVGIVNDDVIIAKAILYNDFVDERHIPLTEEQYNTIITPCKLVDGEFVPSDFPKFSEPEPEPTTEELLNIILGVNE
jgi:hypothetical protein